MGSHARSFAQDASPHPTTPGVSTHDLFEMYDRRFAEAKLRRPHRDPARPDDRRAIIEAAKYCLGIRDEWIPTIHAEVMGEVPFDGGQIERLKATSWPGVAASALLYRPDKAQAGPLPLVVQCCGHGKGCKLAPGYQRMARHIARRGAMVLVLDNIGQGEREPMGHRDSVKPFACGLSVQGLIVMETLAWVKWASQRPGVDPKRLAAIGNSGGGTLALFLAALCPELAVLSSSGYPSTFEYVARKEKKHCHCNILPGILGELEMWQLLSCFAPRPLFIFMGSADTLFGQDLFHQVARETRDVYRSMGAENAFLSKLFPGDHPWDEKRTQALGAYLAQQFHLDRPTPKEDPNEALLADDGRCYPAWPSDALTADTLAEQLTGRQVNDGMQLWDVFPLQVPAEAKLEDVTTRGSTRQIFAQYEAFLQRPRR
jgi:dienelactone hydrolase